MFEALARGIHDEGFAVLPRFLSTEELSLLTADFSNLYLSGLFRRAGIGRGEGHQLSDNIRRDEIFWFEPRELTEAQTFLWARFEKLREALNEHLLLGLWDFEGHYARYEVGAFYRRHLDRFADENSRKLSVVLYLNDSQSGGELILYPKERKVEIMPQAGKLIVFLSGEVPHEVNPTNGERRSFAGWFRTRD